MKLSNFISISRIAFLFIHLFVFRFFPNWLNILIVVGNYLLDSLDGYVSRKLKIKNPYGEFMDISVDRIITLSYFVFHVVRGMLPLIFFILILSRNLITDYIAHFDLIIKQTTERHKLTKGWQYWVYSSKISKIINGGLQMLISAWGFVAYVPVVLQLIFLINSYVRGLPSFKKLEKQL